MAKIFIILGVIFLLLGLLWPWLQKMNLGHLPGDIVVKRENFSFYFPLVTCLVLSIVISLILWLFRK